MKEDAKKVRLVDGVKDLVYGFSEYHALIGDMENIGINGENLTIVVLSCNRVSSTIKLLDSVEKEIPSFAGVFLIMDNGSEKSQLLKLKKRIKKYSYQIQLVELGKNYGVAGGRNKAIQHIKTDWFMSLDNDIYFIKNPFKNIQESIAKLGCKFLNMPLLDESQKKIFANGGHLYIEFYKNNMHVGAGSLFEQSKHDKKIPIDLSLSTFLFGGSSVINKKTFIECGMFDENMFVGFEDIDFSVSIFKSGYKIGNCSSLSLVHDHKISKQQSDLEYEKERFSSKKLLESALYIEKKHGFKVWSDKVEEWLENKHALIGSKDYVASKKQKPLIVLVADSDTWSLSNIAKQVMARLSDKYDFKYIIMDDLENIIKVFFLAEDSDLVHFFWRGHVKWLNNEHFTDYYLGTLGFLNTQDHKKYLLSKLNISTAVYDHLYLENDALDTRSILKYTDHYYVSSNKLDKIYNKIDIKKPKMVVTDGVDLKKFYPKNLKRFDNIKNKKIVIGWVGNSEWSGYIEDFKGVKTILKPAITELQKEGYDLEMFFADKAERMIPHDEMNDYYSKIDLYICTSKIEGTPNPVLEAMACGIPVISTDVGIVDDAFGLKQKEMILKERSIECLKEKILTLIKNDKMFRELSKENLKSIEKWSWAEKVKDFDKYFMKCLKDAKNS